MQGCSIPEVFTRITDYVDHFAVTTPDAEAVVFGNERMTYKELKFRVDRCARALLASGVSKGDRVAMLCTSRPEFWVVFLATTGIGAVWVGLNPKYRMDECHHVVGDSEPLLLFSLAEFEGRHYGEEIAVLISEHECLETVVSIGGDLPGAESFDEFLDRADRTDVVSYRVACSLVERLDPAMIVYTSGSTGKPKGAVLSHFGLAFGATMQTRHFSVERPSLTCSFPINHVASVADTCATTLIKGGKIVFQERFDPGSTLAAIAAESCTIWAGVPTMFQLQLSHLDFPTTDMSSVELVVWGGAAMPRGDIARLEKLGARLMAVYGMTETSAHVTYTEEGVSVDVLSESVGKPDRLCPCRIVDAGGGTCAVGETGELQFKGELMMLGYWRRPDATSGAFTSDGWLRTGDTGFRREDGNIQIAGRLSEMFKSGGYNVYPREIEAVLESHPSVSMAAVIGVPDDLYQEVGHAYVLIEPDGLVSEEELDGFCKNRLANYKVPKRFFIRDELPMLPVGKIDKTALKKKTIKKEENNRG